MKNLFNLIALFLLTSCVDQEVETSGTLTEKAMVVTLIHSPSEHKTEITRTMHTHSSLLDEEDKLNKGDSNIQMSELILTFNMSLFRTAPFSFCIYILS